MDLILDLVGYVPEAHLRDKLLIEPSAGDGSFLLAAIARLMCSCRLHEHSAMDCEGSIAAFEVNEESVLQTRSAITKLLIGYGVAPEGAAALSTSWIQRKDYLLETGNLIGKADFVVGNPPYIRLEDLENGGALYRSNYQTMTGRADIYVAFYEAALRHLRPGGLCGFICADRWMFNQYGASLRQYITANFSVDFVVQMHHADAFEEEVSAYPAVSVISKSNQGSVVVATLESEVEKVGGAALAYALKEVQATGIQEDAQGLRASRLSSWFKGNEPWPLMEPAKLRILKRLEEQYPNPRINRGDCRDRRGNRAGQGLYHYRPWPS